MDNKRELLSVSNSRKLYIPVYAMIIILFNIIGFIKLNGYYLNNLVFIVAVIFMIVAIVCTEIHRSLESYKITSNCLISSSGFFSRKIKKISMESISNIAVAQTIWQRLLFFGDVRVSLFSKDSRTSIKNIGNPFEFSDTLEKKMNEAKGRSGTSGTI